MQTGLANWWKRQGSVGELSQYTLKDVNWTELPPRQRGVHTWAPGSALNPQIFFFISYICDISSMCVLNIVSFFHFAELLTHSKNAKNSAVIWRCKHLIWFAELCQTFQAAAYSVFFVRMGKNASLWKVLMKERQWNSPRIKGFFHMLKMQCACSAATGYVTG